MDSNKVSVRRTKLYGRAVFAKQNIKKGTVIAVFDGPLLDNKFNSWTKDLNNHAVQVGRNTWRDSIGLARYINHSCDPNCGIKRLNRVVAMCTIKKGEQITWDYEMTEKNRWWRLRCRCGSKICRNVIGNYENMPKATRAKYRGYISSWLTKTK